jgi:putative spermidine/putrescine transport system substrate-binding protein
LRRRRAAGKDQRMTRIAAPSGRLSRRRFVGGVAAAAGALVARRAGAQSAGASATDSAAILTVSTWGGVTQDAIKAHMQPLFERQTGARLAFDIGNQGVRYNKLLAQRANPPADVFFSTEEALIAGHRAGLLTPANRANLPNLADLAPWALTVKDFGSESTVAGVPYSLLSLVLAYNPEIVKVKPTSWSDLWRPEFQGKLVMPGPVHSLMPELVVIATELAGGTAGDPTPGLRKLAALRPAKLSLFWTDWAPLAKSGDVVAGPEFDYYIETMKSQGYPVDSVIPTEKGIAAPEYVSVVKGTPRQPLAEAFLNLTLDPTVQRSLAIETYQGPTNRTVQLEPAALARCACGARVDQLRFFDVAPFVDARPALIERLNTEVLPQWGTR